MSTGYSGELIRLTVGETDLTEQLSIPNSLKEWAANLNKPRETTPLLGSRYLSATPEQIEIARSTPDSIETIMGREDALRRAISLYESNSESRYFQNPTTIERRLVDMDFSAIEDRMISTYMTQQATADMLHRQEEQMMLAMGVGREVTGDIHVEPTNIQAFQDAVDAMRMVGHSANDAVDAFAMMAQAMSMPILNRPQWTDDALNEPDPIRSIADHIQEMRTSPDPSVRHVWAYPPTSKNENTPKHGRRPNQYMLAMGMQHEDTFDKLPKYIQNLLKTSKRYVIRENMPKLRQLNVQRNRRRNPIMNKLNSTTNRN